MVAPLLEACSVSKAFPGVQALSDVSLPVLPGVVHAVVGENGAGKSTLMRILAGVYPPDSGDLRWDSEPIVFSGPTAARRRGISTIYQEFNLFPDLTVAENVMFGHEPRTRYQTLDWAAMRRMAAHLLGGLAADVPVDREVHALSVAQQQLVEIAKALSTDARVVIMDEPTAALNPAEVARLFDVIARLKGDGRAVLFISHRLDEVLAIADTITVLKDGNVVGNVSASATSKDELVRMMVGRPLSDAFPPRRSSDATEIALSASGLVTDHVHDVSFDLRAGEILGLAGLEGHGQVYVARALAGLEALRHGSLSVGGKRFRPNHPADAIAAGIVFVSDDRKGEGLALTLSVSDNVALPNLGLCAPRGLMQFSRKRSITERAVSVVGVRTPSIDRQVQFLSGGNQQKVVLAKWLVGEPQVYVFVEPTRGIDVGAKLEIYRLMRELADEGRSIVMVSSDMLELIGMSDRILVMRDGRIVTELSAGAASEEAVMRAAAGMGTESAA